MLRQETDKMPRRSSLCMTVLCLSLVFVAQLDPTSQIVICFLFAQPLVCKLLSVNQATNYTAAAAEWNHFYLRGSLELSKNCTKCKAMAAALYLFLFNIQYPEPVSLQANRHSQKQKRCTVPARETT